MKSYLFQFHWLKNFRYFLTCLLYVSNCVRAAFAFLTPPKLTVLCMYIMFVSKFSPALMSFRSCSFWRYISTVDSSLFALSGGSPIITKIKHYCIKQVNAHNSVILAGKESLQMNYQLVKNERERKRSLTLGENLKWAQKVQPFCYKVIKIKCSKFDTLYYQTILYIITMY